LYWPFWLKVLAAQLKAQLLAWQDAPTVFGGEPHDFPQPPQWAELFVVLISHPLPGAPSQLEKPGEQPVTTQEPPLHADVAFGRLHTFPQTPQWLGLEARLTHEPLQFVRPAPQLTVHAPAEQTLPGGHTTPHPPQLLGSLATLLQAPEQSDWPGGHWQTPPLHV
jgi:hypothetical protein